MSPWNYPVLLTLEPLIDALAAGNTAVVKPSAYAPSTSRVMREIIEECFANEYVSVVTGGRAENQALLNQRFDKIFFTGGKTVGREVLRHAAEYLTPVTLELGGKSPCIVDSTAKIPLAARRIVFGKYLNCGQTCVAPDYILCDKAIRDQLTDAIKSEIRRQFSKHPLENPNYGKIINRKHFQRLQGLIDSSKVVIGGQSDAKPMTEPSVFYVRSLLAVRRFFCPHRCRRQLMASISTVKVPCRPCGSAGKASLLNDAQHPPKDEGE